MLSKNGIVVVSDLSGAEIYRSSDVQRVRCSYTEKLQLYPQGGEIDLYNTDESAENEIVWKGVSISFFCSGVMMCSGSIVECVPENRGQAHILRITFVEHEKLFSASVCHSLSAGATHGDVIRAVAENCSDPIETVVTKKADEISFPRGVAIFGKAVDEINLYCQSIMAFPYIDGDVLRVVSVEDFDGFPENMIQEEDLLSEPSVAEGYCFVKVFPELHMKVGSVFRYNERKYVVILLSGSFDTREGQWESSLLGAEITSTYLQVQAFLSAWR